MDEQNKSGEPPAESAGAAASAKSFLRWGLILPALGAVGAGIVIAVLVLQVTEYRFYKAPENVWPGAKATVSAPVPQPISLTPLTSAAAPAIMETAITPSATAVAGLPGSATTAISGITTATGALSESVSTVALEAAASTAAPAATPTPISDQATVSPGLVTEATNVPLAAAPFTGQAESAAATIPSNGSTPLKVDELSPSVATNEVAVPVSGF
ncbi:MAG: hypothetical protein HYV36_00720 [Lentisphaerae bacterium]|nr:hypothetical protein [Lentisphaerota bacterium]